MSENSSSGLTKITIATLDLGLIGLAFVLSFWLRFDDFKGFQNFFWLFYLSAPLILFLLLLGGSLSDFRYRPLRQIVKSTTIAFILAGMLVSAYLYLSKTGDYSRLLFGNFFAIALVLVLLEKTIVKKTFEWYLAKGRLNDRIALIGFGERFERISNEIVSKPQLGLLPVLSADPREHDVVELAGAIWNTVVDEVYVCYPRDDLYHKQIDTLLVALENYGLPVRLALNFEDLQDYYGQHYCLMADQPGLLLAPHNLNPDQIIMKRLLDLVGSLVGLFLLLLVTPILYVAIKLDSPGPVFFTQIRVGKGGRVFNIYKFRSMFTDAEARKTELQDKNVHDGPIFKMKNDPRITNVGRFIRKYSLDELPQFWNVLVGDMTLVGARPPTIEEVEQYQKHHYRRISLKPGLTGLWQVSGKNEVSNFDEIVALDVQYIKNWNIWTDITILLRTVKVVLFPGNKDGV